MDLKNISGRRFISLPIFLILMGSAGSCSWLAAVSNKNARTLHSEIHRIEAMIEEKARASDSEWEGALKLEVSRLEREREILERINHEEIYSVLRLKAYKEKLKSRANDLHSAIPIQQARLQKMKKPEDRNPASNFQVEEEELYQMLIELGRINHEFMVVDRLLMLYKAS